MWADDFISLRSWIVFLSSYFCIVCLLLLGICVIDMDSSDILTKTQCGKVLERYTGCKKFDIKFYSVIPLQSQLEGLMGEQHILKIHYQVGSKENIAQFFLKVLSDSNPVMFNISRSIYAYEKESFYYESVVPLLKSIGLQVNYVPKSYFSEPYVVVLEDLSLRNLKGTVKNQPLDLQHCKKCMETLAKFHADPILYELAKSKELGRDYSFTDEFSDILEDKVFSKEENGATKFFQSSIQGLFLLIDLIPENGVDKTEFKITLQSVLDNLLSSETNSMGFRSTLIHGDLWSNNFLFRYENANTEITECILIDFQTLKYGPPAFDVLQFILTNTRKSFRDQHQNELLTHYYNFFSSSLAERGYLATEVLTENEFQESCGALALPAKIQAVVDRSITFMVDENHLDAAKSEETFSNYLFEGRGKYIVEAFNGNEEFRELMIEDIIDLRDMLFAK